MADRAALADSLVGATGEAQLLAINNDSLNITHDESEVKAYGVSSVFAQYVNKYESAIESGPGYTNLKTRPERENSVFGKTNIKIWDSSWKGKKVHQIRALRSARIREGLDADQGYKKIANQRLLPRE